MQFIDMNFLFFILKMTKELHVHDVHKGTKQTKRASEFFMIKCIAYLQWIETSNYYINSAFGSGKHYLPSR